MIFLYIKYNNTFDLKVNKEILNLLQIIRLLFDIICYIII